MHGRGGFRLLMTLPILMCFLFFLFTTISFWGFDSFLPASLFEHHGIPEAQGTFALSVFFGFTALGILIGGVIADRTVRHGQVAVLGFTIAAICIFLVGEVSGGVWLIYGLIAAAGIGAGIVTPSRDLIVRKVTPAGQTGKVFAFMTVGMDAGFHRGPAGLWLSHGSGPGGLALSPVSPDAGALDLHRDGHAPYPWPYGGNPMTPDDTIAKPPLR